MSQRSEIDSLSPVLQTIPLPPREVSLSAQLYLRLSSNFMFGWFIAGFGFIFALIAVGLMRLDDAIPRIWNKVGKAKIIRIEDANFFVNNDKIYAYHFEAADPAGVEKITGVSYGYEGKYETGSEVVLQKAGKQYRIQGLTLTKIGSTWWTPLLFFGVGCLVGIQGLRVQINSWFAGGRAIELLQHGSATVAMYLDMSPTNMQIIGKHTIMQVNFEYQVAGETYTVSVRALDTSRLTDAKHKIVFYNPMSPKQSVVLDSLPSGIHFDEFSGSFWASPLRCLLPLLAAAIVCGQIVAIAVLALQAI